jgi:transposase
MKNWVHACLLMNNISIDATPFTKEHVTELRKIDDPRVQSCLRLIDGVNVEIREASKTIEEKATDNEDAKLLMTIPGVGHYSALLISSEIADIDRFPDPDHLCSYARLSPGVHQSGDTQYTFKGAGNSMLSWIMVQCTRVHVRRCDSAITRFYVQVRRRRGEKVAIVAAARKLMKAAYIMQKEEKAFRLDG